MVNLNVSGFKPGKVSTVAILLSRVLVGQYHLARLLESDATAALLKKMPSKLIFDLSSNKLKPSHLPINIQILVKFL